MSFRELRNFTEIMRALGYPRLISVENFRSPNFALVADVLFWMVQRYDPSINVSDDIDSEQDRVDFLTSIAHVMLTRARIKLNTRRLYASNGLAVKELLKVATMLYSAMNANEAIADDDSASFTMNAKLNDLKTTRALGSEITTRGARLFDLLGNEIQLRKTRSKALRFLDSISNNLHSDAEQQHIERCLRNAVQEVSSNVEALTKQSQDLAADKKALTSKIKKTKADFERKEKRLKSLQTVRPAFMDEYEKLERELEQQYEVYLERFRNLDYLEHEMDMYNKSEKEKLEASERAMKRMQRKLREEELRILRGEQNMDMDAFDDNMKGMDRGGKRPGAAAGRREGRLDGGHNDRPVVMGSMSGRGVSVDSESDVTESDGSGLSQDDDSDSQVSLGAGSPGHMMDRDRRGGGGRGHQQRDGSDESDDDDDDDDDDESSDELDLGSGSLSDDDF